MSITPDSVYAVAPKTKHPDEDEVFGWDFTDRLAADESLAGSPTVTIEDGGPTVVGDAVSINAAEFDDDSIPPLAVAVGKAVVAPLTGGTPSGDPNSPAQYKVTVTSETDKSQVPTRKITLVGYIIIEN